MKILITGIAGFIGYQAAIILAEEGHDIIGIDNLNDYYDLKLKKARLFKLNKYVSIKFIQANIEDSIHLNHILKNANIDKILHLAAQAGVQYSIINPEAYLKSNLVGFFNILNLAKLKNVKQLIYASSSSVYGANKKTPFKETDKTSTPLSFYAATKISNEVMAHSFSQINKIETIGLRFFTVYGPYGRPDMSPFIFADSIINNKKINLYNNGYSKRDFTHIEDVIEAISLIVRNSKIRNSDSKLSKIYNIGSSRPILIIDFLKLFEKYLKKKANIISKPLLVGDVIETYADTSSINKDYGFEAKKSLEKGISNFVEWYKDYYS